MVTAAELIAEARASRVSRVTVDGREFCVRRLGAREVMTISQRSRAGTPLEIHEWLAFGVCNEDGSAFFTDEEALSYAEAAGFEAVRLADAVAEQSGLGQGNAAKN